MSSERFTLTLFTSDPQLAASADAAGVDRIGLDLESLGKQQRQGHLNCWISPHRINDLPEIADQLSSAELFVRTQPVNPGLEKEVEEALFHGVRTFMLPMFKSVREAERFVRAIDGRARAVLLVETAEAAKQLREIVRLDGVDEIHIGLNDLHMSLGMRSHFELLQAPLIDRLADIVISAGLPLGIGGVGRWGDPSLPIPADPIFARYAQLGATRSLVSRVFTQGDWTLLDLPEEIQHVRDRIEFWSRASPRDLEKAKRLLRKKIDNWDTARGLAKHPLAALAGAAA